MLLTQIWGHEACLADLATASVDVVLVVLLLALAVGLCRPDGGRWSAAHAQPRQPTLSERTLLLELTAALMILVAWIRLVYAANDHGWRELIPQRCRPVVICKVCLLQPSMQVMQARAPSASHPAPICCVRRPYVAIVTVTRTLAWALSIGVLRAYANSTAARGSSGRLPPALVLMWTLQTAGVGAEGVVIIIDSSHHGKFYPEVCRLRADAYPFTAVHASHIDRIAAGQSHDMLGDMLCLPCTMPSRAARTGASKQHGAGMTMVHRTPRCWPAP